MLMPKRLLVITILVSLIACAVISYYIYTGIVSIETQIARNNFYAICKTITAAIIGNLSALSNDLLTSTTSIDACYNSMSSTGRGIDASYLQSMLRSPYLNSEFTVYSVNVVRRLASVLDFRQWITLNSLVYDRNVSIFQVSTTGAYRTLNETNSTVAALSVVYPNGVAISVPRLGLWDIYPNSPSILDSYYNMSRGQFNPSVVNTVRLADSSKFTSLSVGVSLPPRWLGFIVFNPTNFLDALLVHYPYISISIEDESGSAFYSKGDRTAQAFQDSDSIVFPYRKWYIRYGATTHVDTSPATIALILILIITLITIASEICIYHVWIYSTRAKLQAQEVTNLQRQKVQYHNQHYILHQIRNVLNVPHAIFQMEPEANTYVRDSIDQCIKLTTDVLVFEQLFSRTYVPNYELINLRDFMMSCTTAHKSPVVVSYNNVPENIYCDAMKLREIIMNGYSNACKHTIRYPIVVRIQYIIWGSGSELVPHLLIEILNRTNAVSFPGKDMFVPSFMRKDQSIWPKESLEIFTADRRVYDGISGYFGLYSFSDASYINTLYTGEASEYFIRQCCENAASFGIGLSLARMISKALGGDAGLELDLGHARFWSVIKIPEYEHAMITAV
jgi:hypothetical protein